MRRPITDYIKVVYEVMRSPFRNRYAFFELDLQELDRRIIGVESLVKDQGGNYGETWYRIKKELTGFEDGLPRHVDRRVLTYFQRRALVTRIRKLETLLDKVTLEELQTSRKE